jgi:hypothetical protein
VTDAFGVEHVGQLAGDEVLTRVGSGLRPQGEPDQYLWAAPFESGGQSEHAHDQQEGQGHRHEQHLLGVPEDQAP